MPEHAPMPMCPMAQMCRRMMEKRSFAALFVIPAVVLIAVGILIAIEPRVLVWFIAAGCILIGVMILFMANLVRRRGESTGR